MADVAQSDLNDDCANFLAGVAAQGGVRFRNLPIGEARAAVSSMTHLDAPCLTPCKIVEIPATGSRVACRLYVPYDQPDHPSDLQIIVYLHGGGWMLGNLETCDALCRHLATRTGYRVLSVDYRLAPEHTFPTAYDDVLDAIHWVMGAPAELGKPPSSIALAGDSAGAALAASAALACVAANVNVSGLMLLYPVTDISQSHPSYERFGEGFLLEADDMKYFAESYAPKAKMRSDPRASPLLATDLSGLPPTTLFTCGCDVLRDEGREFGARLITAGVETVYFEAAGHIHGIATLRAAVPSAQSPIDDAIDAFGRQLARETRTIAASS